MSLPNANSVVVITTLNAAPYWPKLRAGIEIQGLSPEQILVIDSSSTDETPRLAQGCGFRFIQIPRDEFNHGGTRQRALEAITEAEIVVYLTQDAVLAKPDSISRLLSSFEDGSVGAAFGRQLPHPQATPIEAHARLFNYPHCSSMRSLSNRRQFGFKAIFLSNSFAAYRRSALDSVNGFPSDVIFGEDTVTAGRLLKKGWQIAYVAEAEVFHSHAYTMKQEFKRYFDIGVLHSRESWLLGEFGAAGGEGRRFIQSELKYLLSTSPAHVPSALVRSALKMISYRLGRNEARFSPAIKMHLSMHHAFWARDADDRCKRRVFDDLDSSAKTH